MKIEKIEDGIKFTVKVQPKASQSKVAGVENKYLKIKVTSPPIKGKANRECVKVLAKWIGVKVSQVRIEKGQFSQTKKIKIEGNAENLIKKFKNKIEEIF